MLFCTYNHSFIYELEKLARLFMPFEKFQFSTDAALPNEGIFTGVYSENGQIRLLVYVHIEGRSAQQEKCISSVAADKTVELELALLLYACLTQITGYTSPWGILTGVRPAKLMARMQESEGEEATKAYFSNTLLVSDSAINLCKQCADSEKEIIGLSQKDSYSLYISIPFCPSRCSYCSFVSHSIEKAANLIPKYLDLLCEELKVTAQIAKQLNLRLETIYFGGGTPSILTAEQIWRLFGVLAAEFDLSSVREITFEAGRPDTLNPEKLQAIFEGGADRISINPQTMNNAVLEAIGRRHTAEDILQAYDMACKVGFKHINMDLIAGLQSDTVDSFLQSITQLVSLAPQSITIHSLSMKRAANLNKNSLFFGIEEGNKVQSMLVQSRQILAQNGYAPYYMYRQSKTIGNAENVGYAKAGYSGLYNVYIMDETHTILACGASAVTKLKQPNGPFIERIFNYKYPYEYIDRFDEILSRKKRIGEFYDLYR